MRNFTRTLIICTLFSVFFFQKINAQVTVNGGTSAAYTSLGAAFAAINAGTHTGAITVDISASVTETASAVLNSSGAGSANYTSVLIFPSADGVSVTGVTAVGRGLIELNGADNVTIDGDNPNTPGTNRNLTLINSSANTVAYTSVVRLATGTGTGYTSANNNTILNLIISGSAIGRNVSGTTSTSGSENTTFGVIVGPNGGSSIAALSSVSTGMGTNTANDFSVNNCRVSQCARAIALLGSASSVNNAIITNNEIGTPAVLTGTPPFTSPATSVYSRGIYVAGANALNISGNLIQNVMSYVGTAVNGIELNAAIGSGVISVSNNTITGIVNNGGSSTASGIVISAANGSYTVAGNSINNIQTVGTGNSTGLSLATTASSAFVSKNRISEIFARNPGYSARGIVLGGGNGITVSNNFIWNRNAGANNTANGTTGGVRGINITLGTGHKIYHNTISLSGVMFAGGTNPDVTACLTIGSTSYSGIEVKNNIFSNTMSGGNSGTNHTVLMLPGGGTSGMNLQVNNNAYYSSAGFLGLTTTPTGYSVSAFNPGSASPSTNWRSYTSLLGNTSNDNASFAFTTPPPFISATDLHINNSGITQLESSGASIGVTSDFDNDVRPGPFGSTNGGALAADIGADEFDGIPDLGPDVTGLNFASPVPGGCFGPNQIVAVVIKNTGLSAVNFATNNASVNVTASGVNPFSFPSVILSTGTLPSGGTQTVIISSTYNMSSAGTYSFNGTVSTAGDAKTYNDVFTTGTVNIAPVVPLPEAVNFTGFSGSNLNTVFPNWREGTGATTPVIANSTWVNQMNLGGAGNVTAKVQLNNAAHNEWIIGPKIFASPNTNLTFDAAVTNYQSTTQGDVMGSDDMVRVMVSTDCGLSYAPVFTVSAANNLGISFTNFTVSLGAYAGQNIIVAFLASDGPVDNVEDYDFHLDNINLFDLPPDAGISAMTSPTSGCFSSVENVVVNVNNFGTSLIANIPVSVVISGALSQTLTGIFAGPLLPSTSASFTVGMVNMSTAGTYSFKAYTSIGGDANVLNDTITAIKISNVATAPVVTASSPSICDGTTSTLSSNAPNIAGWYATPVGGSAVATGTLFVTPTLSANTTYYAQDSIAGGCYIRTPYTVTVIPNPTVTVVSSSTAVCSGNSATLTASGATTYTWSSGALAASTVETPTATTIYSVTGDNSGCVGTETISLTMNSNPTVNAVSSSTMICTGQSVTLTASGANTYTWSTSTTSSVTVETPLTTTSYTVIGEDANGCMADFVISQMVSQCTGIEAAKAANTNVKIYPNPNSGILNVVVPDLRGNSVFELYDALGKIVVSVKLSDHGNQINISQIPIGIYSYCIKSDNLIYDYGKLVRE